MHVLPDRHQAHARDPDPHHRGPGRRERHPPARGPRREGEGVLAVRARPDGAEPRADHPALLPRRVHGAHRGRAVPGEEVQGADPLQAWCRDKCTGCMLCAKVCPTKAARGERKKAHTIDQATCIKCGLCHEACRFDAISIDDGEALRMPAEMIEITLDGRKLLVEAGPDHPRGGRKPGAEDPHAVQRPAPRALRLVLGLPREGGEGEGASSPPAARGSPRAWSITTGSPDVARCPEDGPRAAALQPLRRLQGALHPHLPVEHRHPGLPRPGREREVPGGGRADPPGQPHAVGHRPGLPAPLRDSLPAKPRRRAAGHQQPQALRRRRRSAGSGRLRCAQLPPRIGKKVAVVGGGPAGLAAAWYLGAAGVDVTIFECHGARPAACSATASPTTASPRGARRGRSAGMLGYGRELRTGTALGRGGHPRRAAARLRRGRARDRGVEEPCAEASRARITPPCSRASIS